MSSLVGEHNTTLAFLASLRLPSLPMPTRLFLVDCAGAMCRSWKGGHCSWAAGLPGLVAGRLWAGSLVSSSRAACPPSPYLLPPVGGLPWSAGPLCPARWVACSCGGLACSGWSAGMLACSPGLRTGLFPGWLASPGAPAGLFALSRCSGTVPCAGWLSGGCEGWFPALQLPWFLVRAGLPVLLGACCPRWCPGWLSGLLARVCWGAGTLCAWAWLPCTDVLAPRLTHWVDQLWPTGWRAGPLGLYPALAGVQGGWLAWPGLAWPV